MKQDTIDRFDTMRMVPLLWKLGAQSEQNIIALTPLTAPIERWLAGDLDFGQIPLTVIWVAPRYVSADGSNFVFELFAELDPNDEGFLNVSIQQITSVTSHIPNKLIEQYAALVPEQMRKRVT